MRALLQHCRPGLRAMRQNPAFSIVIVLTLALGIAANTTIFSVMNAVLLRPLPYKNQDRLMMLWADDPKHNVQEEGISYLTFEEWTKQSRLFEDLAICSRGEFVTLTEGDEPVRVNAEVVSANLFPLLGVAPLRGRTFSAGEVEQRAPVVVISFGLWQRRFGAATDAIGKSIEINGRKLQVIGVMPAGFYFPEKGTELWQPLTLHSRWDRIRNGRYNDWFRGVGRLKPGVTLREAQGEMNSIGRRLEQAYGINDPNFAGFGVNVIPLLAQITGKNVTFALWVLFGAVVFVLLIACANAANLLLSRGAARERELATRVALGASRAQLITLLLAEGVTISLVAGLFGFLLAGLSIRLLMAVGPRGVPRLDEISMDATVFVFAFTISIAAGVIAGLVPALRFSQRSPNESLKTGRGSEAGYVGRRIRSFLIITEISLAVVLLSGAGLLVRSFQKIQSVSPGFDAEHVLTLRVTLPQPDVLDRLIERIGGMSGVQGVAAIRDFMIENNADEAITTEDNPMVPVQGTAAQLTQSPITSDFFRVMKVKLLGGRFFSSTDRSDSRLAIINETMARRYWPEVNPVGKRFKFGAPQSTAPWLSVVGVVGDMHRQGLEKRPVSQVFLPAENARPDRMDLVVRTASDPLQLAGALRREIRVVDKTLTLSAATTLEERLGGFLSQRRFETSLLALFSTVALLLAASGIYGLMHYSVVQRTREIGIRVALGAVPASILRAMVREGMTLALLGVGLGVAMSVWITGVLSSLLFDVSRLDPVTFVTVPLVLSAAAITATVIPARRASRVDPLIALRHE